MSDLVELAAAFDVLGAQLVEPIGHTDARFDDLAARLGEDRRLMLVAVDDGVLVGGALAFRTGADAATVRLIAVVDEHRRRGIARALMARVEREAHRLGSARLAAGVDRGVIGFWQRLGYAAQLLVQWVYEPRLFQEEVEALLAGPLRGMACRRSSHDGVPQLLVDLDRSPPDLPDTVDAMTTGCHVGHTVHKDLTACREVT